MIRVTRMADYGVVIMTALARNPEAQNSAADIAERTRLPVPTVRKLLKDLSRAGLVTAQRGALGGYSLVGAPARISLGEILNAVEGPVSLTDCMTENPNCCEYHGGCSVRPRWAAVNDAIHKALAGVSLAQMM